MANESRHSARRSFGQFVRFLAVGGTNTLLTYAVFTGLGLLIEPWVAYTIAFALGLVVTSIASSRFVFRARFSLPRLLLFVASYLAIYGVGSVMVILVDPQTLEDLLVTSLIILVTTTPLVFLVGRFIFTRAVSEPVQPPTPKDRQS
jgi:putative flippase GtrA